MNDKAAFAPAISDRESIEEFADALEDHAMKLARDIDGLKKTPGNRGLIDDAFRAMHNIKGDAALCKLELGVIVAHPVESLMTRFRTGELAFSELFAEVILLAVDRLEIAVEKLLKGEKLDALRLPEMVRELGKISMALPDEIEARCAQLIEQVTGYPPISIHIPTQGLAKPEAIRHPDKGIAADLQFFRTLALQFESHSPLFKGRTIRILRLALETNRLAERVVDPVQLEAAIYMHDIGMLMLPEHTWLKPGHLSAEDRLAMRAHPIYAAGLLRRMPGWEGAADMVAQHHEMPNGEGYPANLVADQICPGAKLIAIVDAFESIMLKHSQRGKNISVLRAIAEINACDEQFAPEWIGHFNTVIRKIAA
ncbi:MAG: HD domain-containing protein [Zoogloeaceae bacterium]|jgi:hypothetical protein|nr:HD domain-containing protein [Zoogloeaceae bacterium]